MLGVFASAYAAQIYDLVSMSKHTNDFGGALSPKQSVAATIKTKCTAQEAITWRSADLPRTACPADMIDRY